MEENSLVDVWRLFNEDVRAYTWKRMNPVRKQARLDYFLINETCLEYVMDTNINPGYRTDHSSILLKLKFINNERGRGYWKFNNSLLKNKDYIKLVKYTIQELKDTYKTNDEQATYNTEFSINDQLFLETLLMIIRGNTIQYSSFNKRKNTEKENKLEADIKKLEEEISSNINNINDEKLNTLVQKKNEFIELRNERIEGVMLRSRRRYEDLGEKPSNYFFNLENRNYNNKVMNKLVNEKGEEFFETKDILGCKKDFYQNLYFNHTNIDETPLQDVLGENANKLSDEKSATLEGEISYTEIANALKNMKNNKSPGLDGFTVEFFKFFWVDIGAFILRSINYGYRNGSLSVTQKQGLITCLPKPNKSRLSLKNWRPISLLNVVYKLASSVKANRVKQTLQDIIHENQKGFIAGRFIGENIRLIYDVLFETKQQTIPGLILSIDFEKAFDTVSWKFISKTLDYFNFGESIKKWIHIFQKGAETSILQNGFMSEFFLLKRGCRQGDPLSPYIFLLCAEVLGQMLRKHINIKGIVINNKEMKISQYADDTQILLDGTEQSLRESL